MTTTDTLRSQPSRTESRSQMRQRQRPLMRQYKTEPEAARIIDAARTADGAHDRNDPVHGELIIGTSNPLHTPFSIHSAVGGDHDGPNPGDFLAAALVGCVDSTLRIIADRLEIEIEELSVAVKGEVDVRGTLCVSPDVPVGFQRFGISVRLRAAEGTSPEMVQMLLAAAEHCCVTLQTLRNGVAVELNTDLGD